MKVIVIGLGSMGKRRIRLLRKYDPSIRIFGIDTNEERRRLCEKEYGIETGASLEEIFSSHEPACAFICTSPLSHHKIITECLEKRMHVFAELNLVSDDYDKNILLAKDKNLVLFLSSTFLYREEIKKMKEILQESNGCVNYTYHVGQYLPDWHPWESYKDFFVGDKRSNGCREIFAIELPWIIDTFGDITKVDVMKNKISSLEIGYNDNYFVMIQHNTGHKGLMAVDVVSRKAVRNMEVFGENLYMSWDGSPTGLKVYDYNEKKETYVNLYHEIDQLDGYSSFIVENAYYNEIVSFFNAIRDNHTPIYSFEKDKEVLKIIDGIEA
ncbi:Gfo/Idh/MocA family oxidoreductase [Mobilitalea sibirica]|uniref:Gfo/Idh/MocA family oxidoreductase n=1 Tax=Mobilitalea sibirica TaxID=1462919 RepID=A0A8J7H6H2_9FIRM|nr:Gfo/Idh/MocA family oxidoreductase [Mobilitalea sibirica]MBH1942479.1 Gfo/Idh/MocA family oxidoreductase [Mobilitalea sibirica]